MSLLGRTYRWIKARREEQLMHRYGGIQRCPWCGEVAQHGDEWSFVEWDRDPFIDVLTCGVCGGTSLWHFAVGMVYVHHLEPPKPKHKPMAAYDFKNATITTQERS